MPLLKEQSQLPEPIPLPVGPDEDRIEDGQLPEYGKEQGACIIHSTGIVILIFLSDVTINASVICVVAACVLMNITFSGCLCPLTLCHRRCMLGAIVLEVLIFWYAPAHISQFQ